MGNQQVSNFHSEDLEDYSDSELSFWYNKFKSEEHRWLQKLTTVKDNYPNYWLDRLEHATRHKTLIINEQHKRTFAHLNPLE